MIKILNLFILFFGLLLSGCNTNEQSSETEPGKTTNLSTETAQTPTIEQGSTENNSEEIFEDKNILTFEEVFEDDLIEVIDYFSENMTQFSKAEQVVFAEKILKYISSDAQKFSELSEYMLSDTDFVGPSTLENTDYLYTYYQLTNNEINLSKLPDEATVLLINSVNEHPLYELTKSFYATDGLVSDLGFSVIISPRYLDVIKVIYDVVNIDKYRKNDYSTISGIVIPNEVYTENKEKFESDDTYPVVLINETKQLSLFEYDDIWKTSVYLPVRNFVYSEETAVPDSKEHFENEMINGTLLDYSKNETIIIPMYSELTKLNNSYHQKRWVIGSVTQNNLTMSVDFSVFGFMDDVEITFYQTTDDQGVTTYYEPLQNDHVQIDIYAETNDFSHVTISGNANGQTVKFTLDDARDPSEYQVIKVDSIEKINLSNVQNGDSIGGFIMKNLSYTKGDDAVYFSLEGEKILTGSLEFSEYLESFALSVHSVDELPIISVEFPNNNLFDFIPNYLFIFNDEKITEILTDEEKDNIVNGTPLEVKVHLKNLYYEAKYQSSFSIQTELTELFIE